MNTLSVKKSFKQLIISLTLILSICVNGNSQTTPEQTEKGTIGGKIIDKSSAEALIGVIVKVKGETTKSTVSDFDGKYKLSLPVGTYNLTFSYIGYQTEEINDVKVEANKYTELDLTMDEVVITTEEIVVKAAKKPKKNATTEDFLLVQQKNAVSMSSGVTAETIKKTPDRTTSDVLKRVSGATIQDGKYAIIRGLNERYNTAILNGVVLPSTESDKKAFSFDIIPANFIDNIIISKTATPDMPGDFAGGLIQINTKDIPEENSQSLQLGIKGNSLTTFKQFYQQQGSNTDFLGVDNGTRVLPNGVDASGGYISHEDKAAQSKLWTNNFSPTKTNSARPNISGVYNISRKINIGENQLGVIGGLTYNNGLQYTPYTGTMLSGGASSGNTSSMTGDLYKQSVLFGGIFNVAFELGSNHKFSFKNLYNINSDSYFLNRQTNFVRDGGNIITPTNDNVSYFSSNKLYSNQFAGEHIIFKEKKHKLKYLFGYNNIDRAIPDAKIFIQEYTNPVKGGSDTIRDPDSGDILSITTTKAKPGFYATKLPTANQATFGNSPNPGRVFSSLQEKSFNGRIDYDIPLKLLGKTNVKFGYFGQYRTRTFNQYTFAYAHGWYADKNKNLDSIRALDESQIFAPQNFGDSAIIIVNSGNQGYTATSKLNAGYLMFENKFTKKLNVVWGMRVEAFNQTVISSDYTSTLNNTDYLPSITAIYKLTEKMNLKGAAYKILNRPEFRECAPAKFYDYTNNAVVSGSQSLKRAVIQNVDLKYEFYPSAGEVLSVNPFYKHFDNPIELVMNPGADNSFRNVSYENQISAQAYGIEFEFRKNLSIMDSLFKTSFFRNLVLYGNYSYIQSTLKLDVASGSNEQTSRPLQGQSPYVFNAGLIYDNTDKGLSVSLIANRSGSRISYVAEDYNFMIWENGRTVLDFQVAKTFFKKLEFRYIWGDLLHQDLVFFYDISQNKSFDDGDIVAYRYKMATSHTLNISYKF